MSTTVNVRVDKSRLTQQLKDNSAATQQQAAQQAVDEAAAEQVRANNEALRRRQQDANAKFRESRHDPIGRRDGGQVTLPNQLVDGQLTGPVVLQDGAAVSVARVGVRRNTSGTKIFVYPWGIEGALGGRLSNDYTTALSQAGGVGVELTLPFATWSGATKPPPSGTLPPYRPEPRVPGRIYDMSPYLEVTSFNGARYYYIDGRWSRTYQFGVVGFPLYDYETTTGYIHYLGDTNPGNNSYTYSTYHDQFVNIRAFSGDESLATVTTEFILPAGGNRALYVVIFRHLADRALIRYYYNSRFDETIVFGNATERLTSVNISGRYGSHELFMQDAASNEVLCVLVDGATATQIEPSDELIAACDELVAPLTVDDATGSTTVNILDTVEWYIEGATFFGGGTIVENKTYRDLTTPAFELSNLPKQPYPDAPSEQQVLDKQLGIGYLETSDHSGKFFTPAIYEWLAGNAALTTRYSEVAPAFYQPGDANNPFVGVYLSVGKGTEDRIEMRASATQPIDITTAHTALDWVTINTGSRYGDYLVWDWGNPEYCQQRLQALGMNV